MKKINTVGFFVWVILLFAFAPSFANASTYYNNGATNLSDSATWFNDSGFTSPASLVPSVGDTGIIDTGVTLMESSSPSIDYNLHVLGNLQITSGTLNLTSSGILTTGSVASIVIDSGASLIISSGAAFDLAQTASLTVSSGATFTQNNSWAFDGFVDLNNNQVIPSSKIWAINSVGVLVVNNGSLTINSGGSLFVSVGSQLSVSSSGTLTNNGTWTDSGGTITNFGDITNNNALNYSISGEPGLALTPYLLSSKTLDGGTNYNATLSHTPVSWSATGLPAGLSINLSTGEITGTPSVTATGTILIASSGSSATQAVSYNFADITAPTITNITSSTANGTYRKNDSVSIQMTFSEIVNVLGTPQLTLETGSTDAVANYSSGGGSNTLTFTYIVGTNQSSSDLDYVSTNSLALNGGTIKDASLNVANLTLPVPGATGSLGANKNIVISSSSGSSGGSGGGGGSSSFKGYIKKTSKFGQENEYVLQLQEVLVKLGFASSTILSNENSEFGKLTKLALEKYQIKYSQKLNPQKLDSENVKKLNALYDEAIKLETSSSSNTNQGKFRRLLRIGDKGEDVKALQIFLNHKGYKLKLAGAGSIGLETEYFGEATKSALIRWQKSMGLIATGEVDAQTLIKLQAEYGAGNFSTSINQFGKLSKNPLVKIGSRNSDVIVIQNFLESKGFLIMPIGVSKGYFGPKTQAALILWQKTNSIIPADGQLNPNTIEKLRVFGL